jgi:hypothetical protein
MQYGIQHKAEEDASHQIEHKRSGKNFDRRPPTEGETKKDEKEQCRRGRQDKSHAA